MSSAVLSPLGSHNGQRRLKTLNGLQAKDQRTLQGEKDQNTGKTVRSARNADKENDGARGPAAPNAVAIQAAENFVTAKRLEKALESIDVKAEGNPAAATAEDNVEVERAIQGAGDDFVVVVAQLQGSRGGRGSGEFNRLGDGDVFRQEHHEAVVKVRVIALHQMLAVASLHRL